MGVFRPYDSQEKTTPEVSGSAPSDQNKGKGAPTPTRKQAEAARRQRVNPVLSKKEARIHEREVRRTNQAKAMAAQDNLPERVLMRDYIDARFNVTEILLPAWILVLAVSLLGTKWPLLVEIAVFVVWGLLALAVADLYLMWRGYKKLLALRHPGASTRGLFMLAVNRALSIRPWRAPAPRVKRGTKLRGVRMYFGFTWRDGDQAMDGPGVGGPFPTQADAEAWLTEMYEDLLARGITSVSLYHEGRPIYGPMSLTE